MMEMTTINIIKLIIVSVMLFSWGMSCVVLDETREKAKFIWYISVGLLFILLGI